jgi:tetratricopeptide (TPR) repeat protein
MLVSALRPLVLVSLLPLLLATNNAKADTTWTEVRSPHFRVITDGSTKDARNVANEFEQMRHVFASYFHNANIEFGAPLTIVAARDIETYRKLDPALWKAQGEKIAGFFFRRWEKQYALIRLDTWGDSNQVVVYHEYTHSVLHANAQWLPMWLDEGMAEFYAYTRFRSDHTYIGAPSMRSAQLHYQNLIPVTTMLEINARSPYYRDEMKMQLFYAESWALVHYMNFGEGMNRGEKLNQFYRAVQAGTNQEKAFEQVFGDPKAFDDAFSNYVHRVAFTAALLPPDHSTDPKTFTERKLSAAETSYELGCFHIAAHDITDGRTLIEKSIELDPNLAGAHEELGFLDFQKGKDDDAQKEWKQATTLDPSLARSLFALTMSAQPSGMFMHDSPDQLAAAKATLEHITALNPNYAPAYVELALIEWKQGSMQQAYKDAHQAETIEPWRASYHLLTGHILLRGNQPALAGKTSRFVATRYFGSDHNEAVDLWNDVPPGMQGDGPALTYDTPTGATVARGRLVDVTCGSAPDTGKFTVTFVPDNSTDGKPQTFTTDGHRLMIGFSDTLWWGEDHFSACHHLGGHPAVIAYKTQDGKDPQLVDLEVRDDLPDNKPATSQTPAQ